MQGQVRLDHRCRARYRQGSSVHDSRRSAQAQSQQAVAHAFALAGAANVVITARSQPELESARKEILAEPQLSGSPQVLVQVTDVTSQESVKALFDRLDREGINIDVLVNNAGTKIEGAQCEDLTSPPDRVLGKDRPHTRIRPHRMVDDVGSQHQGNLSSNLLLAEEDLLF